MMNLEAHKEHFLYFSTSHSTSCHASSKCLIDISWGKKGVTINVDNSGKIGNITNFMICESPFIQRILLYFKYQIKKKNPKHPTMESKNDAVLTLES